MTELCQVGNNTSHGLLEMDWPGSNFCSEKHDKTHEYTLTSNIIIMKKKNHKITIKKYLQLYKMLVKSR